MRTIYINRTGAKSDLNAAVSQYCLQETDSDGRIIKYKGCMFGTDYHLNQDGQFKVSLDGACVGFFEDIDRVI